jgi:predicted acyltransferase
MIFVNDPGDWNHILRPFDHAEWNGFTPTDAIFPFFLFIMGVAGALSLARRLEKGATRSQLARHAGRRGAAIVLVGWALAWFPFTLDRLGRLRIPGVLPRIGLVYALGTWLVLLAWKRRPLVAVFAAVLLGLHTFLLLGLGYDLTREGNVQRAVDLALLKGHLWKKDWDPEGLVSTLSSVATMLTGTLAGWWVDSARPLGRRIAGLTAAGAASAAAGVLVGLALPINKNLWTASYVFLSSALASLALALALLLVDAARVRRGTGFFLTYGKNPLLAFVLSGLLVKTLLLVKIAGADGKKVSLYARLFRGGFSWVPDPYAASHLFALAVVVLLWAVLRLFERKGWYWKV